MQNNSERAACLIADVGAVTRPRAEFSFTDQLTSLLSGLSPQTVPKDVTERAKHCALDFLGVTIAGAKEPVSQIVLEDALDDGGKQTSALIGLPQRVSPMQAVLINGTAARALDFDDVNMAIPGHPSAAIMPALVAASELADSSGAEYLTSFIAGYEVACQLGKVLAPYHYQNGFHATATVGAFGAAAGAAHLMKLSKQQTSLAFGIVSTMAAGLKVNFGTMCKPLHAGLASRNGYHAARLASRGLTSRQYAFEMAKGFVETHFGQTPAYLLRSEKEFALRDNLFKYHAACYNTHAAIEASRAAISQLRFPMAQVEKIVVRVADGLDTVCNIAAPTTGLEAKFSLRFAVAAAMLNLPTGALETFSDESTRKREVVDLIKRIDIELEPGRDPNIVNVRLACTNGEVVEVEYDAGRPESVMDVQWSRLPDKFSALVEPCLGRGRAQEIIELVTDLEELKSVRRLFRATS